MRAVPLTKWLWSRSKEGEEWAIRIWWASEPWRCGAMGTFEAEGLRREHGWHVWGRKPGKLTWRERACRQEGHMAKEITGWSWSAHSARFCCIISILTKTLLFSWGNWCMEKPKSLAIIQPVLVYLGARIGSQSPLIPTPMYLALVLYHLSCANRSAPNCVCWCIVGACSFP